MYSATMVRRTWDGRRQRVAASVPAVAPCDCEPSRLLPICALVQSAARLKAAVIKALQQTHALLTPEQRQRLAYLLRSGQLTI